MVFEGPGTLHLQSLGSDLQLFPTASRVEGEVTLASTNPKRSMGLPYMPYIDPTNHPNVGIYGSPMECMGTIPQQSMRLPTLTRRTEPRFGVTGPCTHPEKGVRQEDQSFGFCGHTKRG